MEIELDLPENLESNKMEREGIYDANNTFCYLLLFGGICCYLLLFCCILLLLCDYFAVIGLCVSCGGFWRVARGTLTAKYAKFTRLRRVNLAKFAVSVPLATSSNKPTTLAQHNAVVGVVLVHQFVGLRGHRIH